MRVPKAFCGQGSVDSLSGQKSTVGPENGSNRQEGTLLRPPEPQAAGTNPAERFGDQNLYLLKEGI